MFRLDDVPVSFLKKQFLKYLNGKDVVTYYLKREIRFFQYRYDNIINKVFRRYTVRIISDSLLPIYFDSYIPSNIVASPRLAYRQKKLQVRKININIHPLG